MPNFFLTLYSTPNFLFWMTHIQRGASIRMRKRGATPNPNGTLLNAAWYAEIMDRHGYGCSFVMEPDSRSYECAVCLMILREPNLTSCCGNHFCRGCIKPIIEAGKPCPLCKESSFTTMRNKGLERELKQEKVWCSYKERGCEWSGELGKLDEHTNSDCPYVKVECSLGCGSIMQRRCLSEHESGPCPNRPWYASFEDPNMKMLAEKIEALSGEKTALKNGLAAVKEKLESVSEENAELKRELVEIRDQQSKDLLERTALLSKLDAANSERTIILARLDTLASRMDDVGLAAENWRNTLEWEDKLLVASSEGTRSRKISSASLDPSATLQSSLEAPLSIVPFSFSLISFKQRKKNNAELYSTPFYSHQRGYNMCIRVDANGSMEGRGTHVSVYAYLMCGEFDDELEWPFNGVVVVRLLNQHREKDHYEKVIGFESAQSHGTADRVTIGSRALRGQGFSQFIPHIDISQDSARKRHYLKDDCLKFVVVAVEMFSSSATSKPSDDPPSKHTSFFSKLLKS